MKKAIMKEDDWEYVRQLREQKAKVKVCNTHIKELKLVKRQLKRNEYMNGKRINSGKIAKYKMFDEARAIDRIIRRLEAIG